MRPTFAADRVAPLCKRYGPGRLPGAERRSVGAGYAMLTAALAATALFLFVTGLAALQTDLSGGLAFLGLVAVPFVAPAAFLAGALTWRYLPERTPYYGSAAGLLATVLTYVLAMALTATLMLGSTLVQPATYGSVNEALTLALIFGIVGFILTFWVTLPMGAVGGYVHERAVSDA